MPPILTEDDQPEDFTALLEELDLLLSQAKLHWQSDRIVAFIARLHHAAGYTPPSPEASRYALSYRQLQTLATKLKNETEKHSTEKHLVNHTTGGRSSGSVPELAPQE
jgi:hypothetical protein